MRAVGVLFSRQPERYVPTLSRGRKGNLHDAVVKLDNGHVDLSPVFKNAEKDVYLLNFLPLPRGRSAASLSSIEFHWDPKHPVPVATGSLGGGLYQVNLLEPETEEHELTGIEAWVFLRGPGAPEEAAAAFQEAVALTQQWEKELQQTAVRTFLRTYLEHLATQETP